MKRYLPMLILILLLYTGNAFAVEFAACELRNGRFVDKFNYAVDIYAVSTADPFELGNTTLNIDFNSAALDLSATALSNQYPLFNGGNYNQMAIQDHPTVAGRLQFFITEAPAATGGDILPGTEILLATVQFDIDNTVYQTEFADLSAVVAQSNMFLFGSGGAGVFLSWTGSDPGSLICSPEISGSPDSTVEVGAMYSFQPVSNDVCTAGPLDFTITNPPAWVTSFDNTTGLFSGTPNSADVGTDTGIIITVSDVYGDSSDLAAFDIEVTSSVASSTSGAGGGGGGGGGGSFISGLFSFNKR